MKRVVSSSITVVLFFAAVATAIFLYRKYTGTQGGNPLKAIPADAAFFVEIDLNIDSISKIASLPFWKNGDENSVFSKIENQLTRLDSCFKREARWKELFDKEHLFVSAHVIKSGQFDILFLGSIPMPNREKIVGELMECLNREQEIKTSERSYEGVTVYETAIDSKTNFAFAISQNVFLGSFTSFLVEDAIRQQKISEKLLPDIRKITTIFSGSGDIAGSRLKVNFNNLPGFISVFTRRNVNPSEMRLENFAHDLDVSFSANASGLRAEGIVSAFDSSDITFFLKSQLPAELTTVNILSSRTAMFSLYYVNNIPAYFDFIEKHENSETSGKLRNKTETIFSGEFGLFFTELSSTSYANNAYFVCKTTGRVKAMKVLYKWCRETDQKLGVSTTQEKYNGYEIGFLRENKIIPRLFGKRYDIISKGYFVFIGDFLIFANQPSSLRSFIDDFVSKKLLVDEEHFAGIKSTVSQRGNYLFYARQKPLYYFFEANLSGNWFDVYRTNRPAFEGWQSLVVGFKRKVNILEATALLYFEEARMGKGVTLAWTHNFDSTFAGGPWKLNDRAGKNKFIMVQDNKNVLHKIDNAGNEVWQKNLPDGILGSVYEVDMYRNNFSQYIFNTSSYLILIDTDGDYISNFPIKLPANAVAGLTLSPQQNGTNKVYIPCSNNRIYAYETNGIVDPEWSFSGSITIIKQTAQHFTIGSKNFFSCFDSTGNVYFLNDKGEQVIKTSSSIFPVSQPGFFLEQEKSGISFITLNNDGTLKRVLINGEVETISNEVVDQSVDFVASDFDGDLQPEYLFLKKDKLIATKKDFQKIFEINTIGLDAGNVLVTPKQANDKSIILTSSTQNKLWVYNTTGKLQAGFPVKGYKNPSFADINNDGNLFLITSDDTGNLYIYSFE